MALVVTREAAAAVFGHGEGLLCSGSLSAAIAVARAG
jgi:hypothetical protein